MVSSNSLQERQVVAFLNKTYSILNDPHYENIIAWDTAGRTIRILDVEAFETKVLPTRFRHTKVKSFIRQLNMYGFKKVKKSMDSNSFYHPYFARDNKTNLGLIHRKKKSRAYRKSEENTPAQSCSQTPTAHKPPSPTASSNQPQVLAAQPTLLSPGLEALVPITPPVYPEPTYFFEVHPRPTYCYMFDDYFDPRFIKPVEYEELQPAFYGFLFR